MNLFGRSTAAGLLIGIYLLLLPEPSTGDLLVGGGIAVVVLALSRAGIPSDVLPHVRGGWSLLGISRLAFHSAVDVTRGTWRVIRVGWRIGTLPSPGFVEIPMDVAGPGGRQDLRESVLGLLATLSPGTVLVDLDPDRDILIFHVVGSSTADFERIVRTFRGDLDRILAGRRLEEGA